MKKAVKILSLMLCIAFVFLLNSCYAAYEKTYLNITDVNGGGSRRVECFFIADGFVHPDSPAGGTHNNDTYFPEGVEAAVNWLQDKVDGNIFTVSLNDTEEGFHVVTVEFSFDSVEDHNQKLALLNSYGGSYSDEVSPAKMSVKENGESYDVIWQEDSNLSHDVTAWMYLALINEGTADGVFNGGDVNYNKDATRAAGNAQDTIVLAGDTLYSVTLGNQTSIFNVKEKVYAAGTFVNDGSFTGDFCEKLPEPPEDKPFENITAKEKEPGNSKTVIWIAAVCVVLLLLVGGFLLLFIRVRQSKLK